MKKEIEKLYIVQCKLYSGSGGGKKVFVSSLQKGVFIL